MAFAFGLSLLAMAYAIGPISGCHINPAVTLGLLVSKKMEIGEAVRYWIAQVLGAIVAAGVLLIIAKSKTGGYDAGELGVRRQRLRRPLARRLRARRRVPGRGRS